MSPSKNQNVDLVDLIDREGNKAAIVFVHGLIGHYRETWGRFPELVTAEPELNHCDIVCWGYPSSLNYLSLPLIGHRLPDLPLVSLSLRTKLRELSETYSDLVLVAHSMGGLVVMKMIATLWSSEKAEDQDLLRRIRHVALYATPTEGVQMPKIAWAHRQIRRLARESSFVKELNIEWRNFKSELSFDVTAVVGREDSAVTEDSAKAFWDSCEVVPGNHTEMCKPQERSSLSFHILKNIVKKAIIPYYIISSVGRVMEVNKRIVQEAREVLFATGSRGRDPDYFKTIEDALQERKKLIYYRVLIGPPQKQALKEHLLRVLQLRNPKDTSLGFHTVRLALYDDNAKQPEVFVCGNETRCLLVLPGAVGGIGAYSTAAVFTRREFADGYRKLTEALYEAGRPIETVEAVQKLPVLEDDRPRKSRSHHHPRGTGNENGG